MIDVKRNDRDRHRLAIGVEDRRGAERYLSRDDARRAGFFARAVERLTGERRPLGAFGRRETRALG